jgi:uncharacterized protein YndB with AHSA1/START domain
MEFRLEIEIERPPAEVWNTLVDVERWPEWTESITRVEYEHGDKIEPGALVKVKQPGMPALIWRVSRADREVSFVWETTSPGVRTVASHDLTVGEDGTTTVAHAIHQTGVLAPLTALLTGGKTRRYVQLEAEGLKRRCESA